MLCIAIGIRAEPDSLEADSALCWYIAALPLGMPPPFFWYQNAYDKITACSNVPAAQCCNGIGHAFSQNSTKYDGFAMRFNSASYQLFSLNVRVRNIFSHYYACCGSHKHSLI